MTWTYSGPVKLSTPFWTYLMKCGVSEHLPFHVPKTRSISVNETGTSVGVCAYCGQVVFTVPTMTIPSGDMAYEAVGPDGSIWFAAEVSYTIREIAYG